MKKTILGIGVAALMALPATAAAYGGPNPPSQAVTACVSAIDSQTASGVTAGGGPKAGIPAPLNCDHFYQNNGIIGNGPPGPPGP